MSFAPPPPRKTVRSDVKNMPFAGALRERG